VASGFSRTLDVRLKADATHKSKRTSPRLSFEPVGSGSSQRSPDERQAGRTGDEREAVHPPRRRAATELNPGRRDEEQKADGDRRGPVASEPKQRAANASTTHHPSRESRNQP